MLKRWISNNRQDAVIRSLEVMGEAVKKIPKETRDKYHDIPWRYPNSKKFWMN